MPISEAVSFFREYVREPAVVGAIAPSSRYLAAALARPFAHRTRPSRALEIGAGTGRVTQRLVKLFGPEDRLDICEIRSSFADLIEARVLSSPAAAEAKAQGRIRVLRCAAQDIVDPVGYDYILSGLPFTAFAPELVQTILEAVRRNLKPGGVFSYFEYLVVRRLNRTFSIGQGRRRIRAVSTLLDRHIQAHQFDRETVLLNVPPALTRHLRFAPSIGGT